MAYSLGCVLALVLGGWLHDIIDFRGTTDFMSLLALIFGLANFAIIYLPDVIKKDQKNEQFFDDNQSNQARASDDSLLN